MKTKFTPEMLAEPALARVDDILSRCTNCGCCNAACPTFEVTGDEREAPRGRINLIADMLQDGASPKPDTVKHLDTCLSCLSCTVACPSGVDYMHLIDHARGHIESNYRRPLHQRVMRSLLAHVLPHPARFGAAMKVGRLAKPLAGILQRSGITAPIGAMLESVPRAAPVTSAAAESHTAPASKATRTVLLPAGCVQPALDPQIDRSAARLLGALGVDVLVPPQGGCCGAINYHLGKKDAARAQMRRNIDAWWSILQVADIDAIIVTASGCGTTVMDYGHIFQDDADYATKAAQISALAKDICAYLGTLTLPEPAVRPGLRVVYHAACSLQHGQRLLNEPKDLLRKAGFTVLSPQDEHMCCGSAGTYSILQPQMAQTLNRRKVDHLQRTRAQVIAGGNIGCLQQIGSLARLPVVHTVALLAWAWTGAVPEALHGLAPQGDSLPVAADQQL